MVTTVSKLQKKNLGRPDGTKEMPRTKLERIDLEHLALTKITLQPGWKWSEDIRPLAKTESCQNTHVQYVISGRLRVTLDNGARMDIEPGDFVRIPPGHDAWVLGNEPFCALDFTGFRDLRGELRGPGTVTAEEAHELLRSDPAAILVCAYEKEEDFRHNDLEGAISLGEFRGRKDSFPKDENVIFYCTCPHDESATALAREYHGQGFINAKVLEGGVEAWKNAGYALVEA